MKRIHATPDFSTFFERIKQATPIQNQSQLAQELGLGRAAISLAKHKNVIPSKWIFSLSRKYDLNVDWLATGSGAVTPPDDASQTSAGIKHILPRLNSNGSPVVKAEARMEDTLPAPWLATEVTSSHLALMTMPGNCMEPEIKPGDRLLIDLEENQSYSDCIYAIGIDEHILVRRIEKMPGQIVLRCDNPHAKDVVLKQEDDPSLIILGRIIWVGRHYPPL